MTAASIEAIVRALNAAGARYLIAGGLAVVAHGYVRFTADVDLVIDLEDPDTVQRALQALAGLGYRPRAPVPLSAFAEGANREAWIRDKGLSVFALYAREHPLTEIDLFVQAPFDFGAAERAALRQEVAPGVEAAFVGVGDLVALKKQAARPQDLQDVAPSRRCGGRRQVADDERLWEVGYDGHQRAQRRRLAGAPLAEKIAWLEQAHPHRAAPRPGPGGRAARRPRPGRAGAPRRQALADRGEVRWPGRRSPAAVPSAWPSGWSALGGSAAQVDRHDGLLTGC